MFAHDRTVPFPVAHSCLARLWRECVITMGETRPVPGGRGGCR
ncbi:hypothetical protein ACL02S_14210 [Nocardia sp. 004]